MNLAEAIDVLKFYQVHSNPIGSRRKMDTHEAINLALDVLKLLQTDLASIYTYEELIFLKNLNYKNNIDFNYDLERQLSALKRRGAAKV